MKRNIIAAAGAALLLSAAAAHAAPITTAPGPLIANGTVQAIYVFNSAGDTSSMSLSAPLPGLANIFCNGVNLPSCPAASAIGDEKSLGSFSNASLVFSLDNLSTSTIFSTNVADGDGNYHAFVTTDFTALGIGAMDPTVAADIAALAPGTTVTYVAWEDLTAGQGSDFDYNDLVFAFTNVAPTTVPEPISVSLFGAGLAGAAWINKRRRAKKA